ncbi:structural maintenance of chromosomes flexible hinge domain-containing protein 1-like [Porites lutea]|uniref:structural maintenance of chromosomes flexible hinge domain-containing protein 1-like n=1 Tax=Porites lutea TaxID=51062 RepID=UPI003CC66B05
MAELNVLLSCGNADKTLKIERDCTFDEFRTQVKSLFPHLPENFTISDGDFNELDSSNFYTVKNSRLETWCLVRGSSEESYKLDKPHSELMRYDVHPNALTQSGNYHFSASYQAFCEFIDNSIQATSINNTKDTERIIDVHIFLRDKLVAIFDNGEGMSYEGLKAFATYFLSQADRGLEKEEVDLIPAYLDGAISKFGVGATQAGFYLGNRIKVITKKEECPYVTEITISKEKLQQRAKEGKPVFEDYRWIRNPSDTSTLETEEEKRCLKDVIEREAAYNQFTMIVITGIRDIHIESIQEDGGNSLAKNLAHVYHFYLFGERGRSGNMKLPSLGNSRIPPELGLSSFLKVDIRLIIDDGRNSNQKTYFNLRDIEDDIESLYQTRAKEWFPFSLTMKVPDLDPHQTVQGVLMYFPHESGQETLPRPDDLEDDEQEPIFECFWQGRLAPLSYVHKMEFCTSPAQRSKRQKDVVPDSCYRRLKGILFFNRHTPVSNNKLKILLDERKDLSTALEDASTERRLPQEFRTWLEKCHRELDKEVSFESQLPNSQQPNSGDIRYGVLRVTTSSGVQVYKTGDVVKLDTKPIIYGKVKYFVKVSKKNDVDKVVVQRQPDEVYLSQEEERPISRILEIPDQNTLRRVFNQEKQMLPQTVKVYKHNLTNEVTSKTQLQWHAGETQKEFSGFWVKIFSGERPPKQLVSVHNKKLSVRQVVEGPENMAPIQNDQPHDGEKFGFKPFWLSKAGVFTLKYIAMLGDREMASAQFRIVVKASTASLFALTEPSRTETPQLALGEPGLKFKLAFTDNYKNPATLFSSGEFVKLNVTCANLKVQGLKEKYKTNSDGVLEVSGIALTPNGSDRVQYGKELSVRVDVIGIEYDNFVTFPVRIKTGQPQSVKLPQFETNEVLNYEEFPEFTVQVLDQWSQPCSVNDRRTKLHAECEAFVGGPHLATIEQGQGRFSPIKVKLAPGKAPCNVKIKISLVSVENIRRKLTVSESLKELKQFTIKVLPSTLPHKVMICEGNQNELTAANGVAVNGRDGRDCLELMAPAGSMVKGLFLKVFDESGKLLEADEFKAAEPRVTTSWNGEVSVENLPYLPDCPVASMVAVPYVGNVECVCSDVKCQTQIRIKPIAGEPQKWLFVCEDQTLQIECDSKRQLSQNLKIRLNDKFGNPAECPQGVEPMVSVEHSPSRSGSTAVFIGNISRKGSEFVFNNEATISGQPGVITMCLYDNDNKFSKDTQRINLKPGAPHHIELKSQAFDDSSPKNEHTAKFFSNCYLSAPIFAFICDKSGNKTPLKTTLNLSWIPASCGQLLPRKTTQKGETVFEAKAMRCGSRSGEQQVKLKVSSPDNKNLQAATVTASLEKSNRVKAVVVKVVAEQNLMATGNFPVLKVRCETEDGVKVDGVGHLNLEISRPRGPQTITVYKKPTQDREGLVTYQPLANRYLEAAGQWSLTCHYNEYRDRLKSVLAPADHVTTSQPVQFFVHPGPPRRLVLRFTSGSPPVLSASCTADVKGRTILPLTRRGGVEDVIVAAEDAHGNMAESSLAVKVGIQPSGTVPDGTVLPALENSPIQITLNHGSAKLPRLTLCSRVGNYIGEYLLVFSAPEVESHTVKFAFSTDEHIQRVQNELQPLRKQIADLEQSVRESKQKVNRTKSEVVAALTPVRSSFRGEPRSRDVVNVLQTTRYQLNQLETAGAVTRPPVIQNGPPARIRQYIKGIVAELAHVSDPLLARILSWFLQSKMQVALTSTTEQQRKVYDAGCPAYCEATLLPFSKRDFDGSDGKSLPLELPSPPSNYRSPIEFAVNLLEFTSDNGYLRCSLFWNLLSKTIVVNDLKSGQTYREHLTKMKQSCPTILTRDGKMIASDGLMDPKRKCPDRLEDLKFAFGALPPRETPQYRQLKEKCESLGRLQKVCENHETEMVQGRSREERLNELRKSLSPRINELEKELRKLRPGLERDSSEPPDKRRKR